jgi:tRNA G18 (ribose-2'-O)-methylase SpoU
LVREQCELLARIALPGRLHSLNAAVAAGIAIYESQRAR